METTNKIVSLTSFPEVTFSSWPAKTCKFGSAMATKNPTTKPEIITIQILLVWVILDPIKFPKGVIPKSIPTKKIVNPIIIKKAPIRNLNSIGVSTGTIVRCSIKTINVIGRTEKKTSLNFSFMTSKQSLPYTYFRNPCKIVSSASISVSPKDINLINCSEAIFPIAAS